MQEQLPSGIRVDAGTIPDYGLRASIQATFSIRAAAGLC